MATPELRKQMADVYAGVVAQPHYLAYSNSGLGFKASFVELRDDAYDAEQTAPFFPHPMLPITLPSDPPPASKN